MITRFLCAVSDVIYPPGSRHLVFCGQLFGDTLLSFQLLYKVGTHFLRLPVKISRIAGQLAGGQQVPMPNAVILLQTPSVTLPRGKISLRQTASPPFP